MTTPWLKYRRERPDAVARLFCLPFAGGSALTNRPWVALVRMDALVAELADAIEPLTDLPYALFGHSMGARVAFELARVLRDRNAPSPLHLFASGSRAPHVPSGGPDLHPMNDADLIGELRKMGGTPDDLLNDPEAMAALLPVLRADFEVLETYAFALGDRIACDITAFRGASDPCASREGTEAWAALTAGRFAHKTYPGNHFFLLPHGRSILTEAGVRIFRSLAELAA
jgi:medium-chain acyl-[acyl-carrier-protein] hydrolase